jgi:hypothetical protein
MPSQPSTKPGVSQPPTPSKRASVSTRNPGVSKQVHAVELGDNDPVVFVFGNGDGVALVSETLAKKRLQTSNFKRQTSNVKRQTSNFIRHSSFFILYYFRRTQ